MFDVLNIVPTERLGQIQAFSASYFIKATQHLARENPTIHFGEKNVQRSQCGTLEGLDWKGGGELCFMVSAGSPLQGCHVPQLRMLL